MGLPSCFIFLVSKLTLHSDCSHEIKRCLLLGRKAMTNLDSVLNSRDITFPTMIQIVKLWFFQQSCMDVTIKKAEPRRIDAFELWCWRRLESPLDCKEIKTVNLKGNQLWIFIGRSNAEAEAPIFWLPDTKSWLFGKDPDAGKDWGREEKGIVVEMFPLLWE